MLAILFLLSSAIAASVSGQYVYEDDLYYGPFPDGFRWGVATAAYQVLPVYLNR